MTEKEKKQKEVIDKLLKEIDGKIMLSWTPVKYRNMTDEEIQETEEQIGEKLEPDQTIMFDCAMPDDGEDILLSTKWGIVIDRCEYDPAFGYGLEDRGDWDGVEAWMSLPPRYEPEDKKP